MSPILESIS